MIFSSPPASSSMNSTPTGRTLITAPGTIARVLATSTSHGSPSSDSVCGNEAVISGVAHRRIEEAVDHQGAGGLVHLVLDRLAADRHLDDDVDLVRRVRPERDRIDTHDEGSIARQSRRRRKETPAVIRGLDPRIHRASQRLFVKKMDCRIKSGNDRAQCVQENATLSRFLPPNRSDDRATMRPPRLR